VGKLADDLPPHSGALDGLQGRIKPDLVPFRR
jgi:hypothetical protein